MHQAIVIFTPNKCEMWGVSMHLPTVISRLVCIKFVDAVVAAVVVIVVAVVFVAVVVVCSGARCKHLHEANRCLQIRTAKIYTVLLGYSQNL